MLDQGELPQVRFPLPKQHRWPSLMRRLRVRGWWQKIHGSGSKCVKSTWIEAWSLADKILLEALHFLKINHDLHNETKHLPLKRNLTTQLRLCTISHRRTWGCTCPHTRQLRSAWCKLGFLLCKKNEIQFCQDL